MEPNERSPYTPNPLSRRAFIGGVLLLITVLVLGQGWITWRFW